MAKGIFTISLDFELYWGVHDQIPLKAYQENLENTPEVVEKLLSIFNDFGVSVTWAIVDAMRFKNKNELKEFSKDYQIPYANKLRSPFPLNLKMENIPDKFLFAKELIKKIEDQEDHEIGTHTFSHFYCLEKGVSPSNLKEEIDLVSGSIGKRSNNHKSIVFPRNQYNEKFLNEIGRAGYEIYRGNPDHKAYEPRPTENEMLIYKASRWKDAFYGRTDHLLHDLCKATENGVVNIPASLFFRPYKKFSVVQKAKVQRMKKLMRVAAEKGRLFHLWWHPHNFGKHMAENFSQLTEILDYFKELENSNMIVNKTMYQASLINSGN